MKESRGQWSGRLGFILAATGSYGPGFLAAAVPACLAGLLFLRPLRRAVAAGSADHEPGLGVSGDDQNALGLAEIFDHRVETAHQDTDFIITISFQSHRKITVLDAGHLIYH